MTEVLLLAIADASQKSKNIIISGEVCGKTAIFRDFITLTLESTNLCFQSKRVNAKNHINNIFQFDHNFTFTASCLQREPLKIFVIDSIEKLAEISNNDILTILIQKLKENAWNIILQHATLTLTI